MFTSDIQYPYPYAGWNHGLEHGPEADGLAAFLWCAWGNVKSGDPIPLTLGLICLNSPQRQVHGRLGPADPGNLSWLTVTGPAGVELPYIGRYVNRTMRDEETVLVWPGSFHGQTFWHLDAQFDISQPGSYRLRWHYKFRGQQLISNELHIQIAAPTARPCNHLGAR